MNRAVVIGCVLMAIGYALAFAPAVWVYWGISLAVAFWLGGLNVTLADKINPTSEKPKTEKPENATPIRQRTA